MLRQSRRIQNLSPYDQNTDQQELLNQPAGILRYSPSDNDGTVVTLPPSLPSHQAPRSFRTSPMSNPSLMTQSPHTDFIYRPTAHLTVRPHSIVPVFCSGSRARAISQAPLFPPESRARAISQGTLFPSERDIFFIFQESRRRQDLSNRRHEDASISSHHSGRRQNIINEQVKDNQVAHNVAQDQKQDIFNEQEQDNHVAHDSVQRQDNARRQDTYNELYESGRGNVYNTIDP